jgi:uncharacterized protein YjbI with pentapeptide repeats
MAKPVIHKNPSYLLLREEKIEEFNRRKVAGDIGQLSGGDYRGLDLRNLDADGLDFSNAYFRGADLRGIDFHNANLEGASIAEANISGCYFPDFLSAEELRMSLTLGIRMRYQR